MYSKVIEEPAIGGSKLLGCVGMEDSLLLREELFELLTETTVIAWVGDSVEGTTS